jgi:hypothetical protein
MGRRGMHIGYQWENQKGGEREHWEENFKMNLKRDRMG